MDTKEFKDTVERLQELANKIAKRLHPKAGGVALELDTNNIFCHFEVPYCNCCAGEYDSFEIAYEDINNTDQEIIDKVCLGRELAKKLTEEKQRLAQELASQEQEKREHALYLKLQEKYKNENL